MPRALTKERRGVWRARNEACCDASVHECSGGKRWGFWAHGPKMDGYGGFCGSVRTTWVDRGHKGTRNGPAVRAHLGNLSIGKKSCLALLLPCCASHHGCSIPGLRSLAKSRLKRGNQMTSNGTDAKTANLRPPPKSPHATNAETESSRELKDSRNMLARAEQRPRQQFNTSSTERTNGTLLLAAKSTRRQVKDPLVCVCVRC